MVAAIFSHSHRALSIFSTILSFPSALRISRGNQKEVGPAETK